MSIIKIDNVSFKYQEETPFVIDRLSLTVEKGEFICVLGKNGSGKSTLAKLLNGMLLPTEGEISVFDMDVKDKNSIFDIRKKVGVVFQNPDNQMVATIVEDDIAYNMAVSVSDYSYDVTSWLFAPERKPGDYTTINTTEASYFIYYLNDNPKDYDWIEVAVGSLGAEAYDNAFSKTVKDNYEAKKKNNSVIAQAWNHSYEIIVPYIQERKDSFALANQ